MKILKKNSKMQKKYFSMILLLVTFIAMAYSQHARAQSEKSIADELEKPVLVTPDNFARAETDMHFKKIVQEGGFGKLVHARNLSPIEKQSAVRMNRDTLYSSGVFDLKTGPVTITLPEAGTRYRSMVAINEDHYIYSIVDKAGQYTYSTEKLGTRYVAIIIRMFVDSSNKDDLRKVHALQNAVVVNHASRGDFEIPNWDEESQGKVRDALVRLGETLKDGEFNKAFGSPRDVDPIKHLIGTATGWGGNPSREAVYSSVTPTRNDGATIHKLQVGRVPVDAFWSISVYNARGYFEPNRFNAYSVNSVGAKRNPNGSVTVQFGGCDGRIPNCLPTMRGWNYTVRMYRPRPEILSGEWKFPSAQPVSVQQQSAKLY